MSGLWSRWRQRRQSGQLRDNPHTRQVPNPRKPRKPLKPRKIARQLADYARQETGAPPPELLRRLYEDIPDSPALAAQVQPPPAPGRTSWDGRARRDAAKPLWLAASLAAAVVAGVVGLHLLERTPPIARSAAAPAAAGGGAPTASGDAAAAAGRGRQAGEVGPAGANPDGAARAADGTAAGAAKKAPPGVSVEGGLAEERRAGRASEAAGGLPNVVHAGPGPGAVEAPLAVERQRAAAPPLPVGGRAASPRTSPSPQRPAHDQAAAQPVPSPVPAPEGSGLLQPTAVPRPPPTAALGEKAAQPAAKSVPRSASAPAPAAPGEKAAQQSTTSLQRFAPTQAAAPAPPEEAGAVAAAGAGGAAAVVGETETQGAPGQAKRTATTVPERALAARAAGAAGLPGLRSSFGDGGSTDFYLDLRRELLDEARLPEAAEVRVAELANAFELRASSPSASGERRERSERPEPFAASAPSGPPRMTVEGAPLPTRRGNVYLLRFAVSGLTGVPAGGRIQVEFDAATVESARRVGATAGRGGDVTALYEVALRPASREVLHTETAASGAAAVAPGPVIARWGLSPAAGALSGAGAQWRTVRLADLRPSWEAASPALREPGLAAALGDALSEPRPAARLRRLLGPARALAAERPADAQAAELLQLIERAVELAGPAAGGARPPSP
jgi:hypothetical protein